MAQITVSINGYNYTAACKDGQEEHLMAMVKVVEEHIDLIRQIGGQSGEGRLLALASLLMADKLYDMERYIHILEQKIADQDIELLMKENESLKKTITDFSERAEALAKKLEIA